MEVLVLTVAVILIGWAVGLLGSLRKTVNIANREITFRDVQHKAWSAQRLAEMDAESIAADVEAAKTIADALKDLDI